MRGVDVLDCTAAMTQHLILKEIDQILKKRGDGKEPVEIHAWLEKQRARKELQAPHLTNVRRVLKGSSEMFNKHLRLWFTSRRSHFWAASSQGDVRRASAAFVHVYT